MENLLAVMLLVGCTADSQTCAEIQVPTPFYSSVADCRGDLALQMRMTDTYDDRVLGSCMAIEEAMLEQSGALEWAVTRGGELVAEFVMDEPAVVAALPDNLNEPADGVQVAAR